MGDPGLHSLLLLSQLAQEGADHLENGRNDLASDIGDRVDGPEIEILPAEACFTGFSDGTYLLLKRRLLEDKDLLLAIRRIVSEVRATAERRDVDGLSVTGRLRVLALGGFFDRRRSLPEVSGELARIGPVPPNRLVFRALSSLTRCGLLTHRESAGWRHVKCKRVWK